MAKLLKQTELPAIRPLVERALLELRKTSRFEFQNLEVILKSTSDKMASRSAVVLVDSSLEPTSFAIVYIGKSYLTTDTWAGVVLIYTKEEHRRKGKATSLLMALPMVSQTLGSTAISMSAPFGDEESNQAIRHLAAKMEYLETETNFTLIM